ncbi:Cytochrome P450 4g15 [Eumeta japonica]|uniref:Cytochrome P450 4g15 n=1 Tax=Eumeta variegata TaxID=151549 RepID=A0A4C1XU74_EUMVA|nr:Cytochrome P450 4g15 [Eumeta japonica]
MLGNYGILSRVRTVRGCLARRSVRAIDTCAQVEPAGASAHAAACETAAQRAVRCRLCAASDASADRVEERSLVPRSRSHARLRRKATMSHVFSCVQQAFIDLPSKMPIMDEVQNVTLFSARTVFYPLVLAASGLWLLHYWQRQSRMYKMGNKIPGPMTLPIFGNAHLALGVRPDQIVELGLQYTEKYGSVIRAWLGSRLFVFLTDPRDVEVILNSQVHIDKASDYQFFKPWLGEGLLISSGEKWRSHRKMIAPTFHINILKSFVDVFNKNSRKVVDKMRSEIGKTFDVHDHMSEVTVDILLETAMGIDRNTQDGSGFDYAMAVMKMCDIVHQRHYKFWLRFDFMFKLSPFFKLQTKLLNIIHGLTNKVIKSKKEIYLKNKAKGIIPPTLEDLLSTPESKDDVINTQTFADAVFKGYRDDLDLNDENDIGAKKRLAFLDLMIESAQTGVNNISDEEIKEEVDTIMFEGHDTTAAGSSFVLCLLGVHQDIQAKVYDELYEIFGDSDRPATFADTLQMKYLERVIFETLRMYPPVPGIARKLKEDVQIATNNYVLPAGSTIVITIFKIHRHPQYYKNPDVFDPDNFLPENTQGRHYYSFIPFSAGPRSCVGRKYALLKLKILLSTVLRDYRVVSAVPEEQFQLRADIILKRADGFRLRLEPRERRPSNTA